MIEPKVNAFLKRHFFQLNDKSIAVGVSGGPDSLALLHYLWSIRERKGLNLLAIHVDHMFRGIDSLEDGLFVKRFCEERQIAFEMARIDVPAFMKKSGLSTQQAARQCRYEFFEKVLKKWDMQYLALGHHGDDQIETMLMRFTRGSSGKARAGIPFSRRLSEATIIRPFLPLTKQELEEYCEQNHLLPRIDVSNSTETYSRNRFRHRVLPFLKEENSAVHEHFQRFSEELQEDEDYLLELTMEKLNKVMRKENSKVTIEIGSFLRMPMPLQRRGIKLILNYLYKDRPASLSAIHIEKVFSMMHHPHPSGTLDFPSGLRIKRSYEHCHFELNSPKRLGFHYKLTGPKLIELENGDVIVAKFVNGCPDEEKSNNTFCVNLDQIEIPLIIRNRKNGDRMTLKGMEGSKKLKDIFIDCKVPIDYRDIWPVVTDGTGNILWLPGLKKSNYSVRNEGNQFLHFTYIKQ